MKLIGYDSDSVASGLMFRKTEPKKKDGFCCYCSQELNKHNFSRDHVHPKSKGGKKKLPCCIKCNREKGSMTLVEYKDFVVHQQTGFTTDTLGYRQYSTKLSNINVLLLAT